MVAQGDLTWLAEMNAHMLSCFVDKFNESNGKQCCRFRNHMRCFFIRTTYFMSSSHRIYPQHEHTQHILLFCPAATTRPFFAASYISFCWCRVKKRIRHTVYISINCQKHSKPFWRVLLDMNLWRAAADICWASCHNDLDVLVNFVITFMG